MADGYKCQVCSKREATWHITDIVNGESRELHLCDDCARMKAEKAKGQSSMLKMTDFLAELVESSAKQIAQISKLVCPHCGMSYLDFHNQQRLGCPNDYEAFGEPMSELLTKIHGETRHLGKVPAGADGRAARQAELRRLRQALRRAVEQEHYEQAALLRDRIQQMEEARGGTQ
jgi:protein arginine kinase activator